MDFELVEKRSLFQRLTRKACVDSPIDLLSCGVCRVFLGEIYKRFLWRFRRISGKGVLRRKSDEGGGIPSMLCDEQLSCVSVLPSASASPMYPCSSLTCSRLRVRRKSWRGWRSYRLFSFGATRVGNSYLFLDKLIIFRPASWKALKNEKIWTYRIILFYYYYLQSIG